MGRPYERPWMRAAYVGLYHQWIYLRRRVSKVTLITWNCIELRCKKCAQQGDGKVVEVTLRP